MKYFVGVDQGGSKTEILIGDENGTLIDKCTGFGYSEFLKIENNDEFQQKYMGQQIRHIEGLLEKSNLKISDIYALVSSIATAEGDLKINYEKILREGLSNNPNISVYNDMYGAWRAGTNKLPSGVMAIGTGTGIMFFNEDGGSSNLGGNIKYQAARGLGYRAFLHACLSALGLFEPTILTESICEFAHTSTLEEALKLTNNGNDLNALSHQYFVPYVYEAAIKKDRVAEDFVNQTAVGFAECIRAGIKDLGWENREIPFVLNGGSFKGKGYIIEKIIKNSLVDLTNLNLFQAEYEPVYGVLMLAYEKYNNGIIPQLTNEDILKFKLKREL